MAKKREDNRLVITFVFRPLFGNRPSSFRTRTWLSICIEFIMCMASQVFFFSCSGCIADAEDDKSDPYPIEELLKKPQLKVLDIGNSYSEDALALLPTVVENCKVDLNDMCLYKLMRGGASFRTWCKVYEDKDTHPYSFNRSIGNLSVPISTGYYSPEDGSAFRRALSEVDWDLIIIHQVSTYAPYYELWDGDGESGCLDELMGIIRRHQPNAKIGFMLVHSYWDNYSGNKEKSSFTRWQKIAESVRRLKKDYGIQFIIPYGTAVENLRYSSLNNKYDLTRDGTHLGYGLCQYTAACCYYESLIQPRTGVSCLGKPALIDVSDLESEFPIVNVDSSNAIIAQKAAILAVDDIFHCNNPEYSISE